MDELMTMGSTYIWRCSKGVYRFTPEIYQALVRQPLTGDLPQECLYHMPEWAVYIETPGLSYERLPMEGFIAHLDYNLYSRGVDLQFAIFRKGIDQPKMIALPLGEGTLRDAMDRVEQVDDMFMSHLANKRYVGRRDEYRQTFSAMIQLLLYICSDEPDMPEIEHPQKRKRLSEGVFVPLKSRGCGTWASASPLRFAGSVAARRLRLPVSKMMQQPIRMRDPARMSDRPTGTRTGQVRVMRCSLRESRSCAGYRCCPLGWTGRASCRRVSRWSGDHFTVNSGRKTTYGIVGAPIGIARASRARDAAPT